MSIYAALVGGKDTVTYVQLAPEMGAEVSDHIMLDLERNPGGKVPTNPEVRAVLPYPDSTGPRVKAAVGPVVFLRRTTLPLVKQFFAEVDLSTCPYYQVMGHLLAYLQQKVTFYGLEVGMGCHIPLLPCATSIVWCWLQVTHAG